MKLIKEAFTAWPHCIATYIGLIGAAALIITNWPK
jgi:hypothetical protein